MNGHAVWNAYDELRTARLNVYYYRGLLARARAWNRCGELVLAASSSTSIAGLWFLATPTGSMAWKLLGSLSAILAVYRSVTRPAEQVGKLEKHVIGWTQIEFSLEQLRRKIHEVGRYDQAMSGKLDEIMDVKRAVSTELIDDRLDEALRATCFQRVNAELPLEQFFVPDK